MHLSNAYTSELRRILTSSKTEANECPLASVLVQILGGPKSERACIHSPARGNSCALSVPHVADKQTLHS